MAENDFELPRLGNLSYKPHKFIVSTVFLLDTNVISEFRKTKSGKADNGVVMGE